MGKAGARLTCSERAHKPPQHARDNGADPAPGGPHAVSGAQVVTAPLLQLNGSRGNVADQNAHQDDPAQHLCISVCANLAWHTGERFLTPTGSSRRS